MALDHTEIIPNRGNFELRLFTDPQRSFGMTDLTKDEMISIAEDIHKFLGIRMWLATVKLPRNTSHLSALKCKHYKPENWDGHCGEMGCPNYKAACYQHGYGPHEGTVPCTRDKVTAACSWSPYCTDQTGEHHTFLVYAFTDGEAQDRARERVLEHGFEFHLTRLELVSWDD
jgi:hypothetical protein